MEEDPCGALFARYAATATHINLALAPLEPRLGLASWKRVRKKASFSFRLEVPTVRALVLLSVHYEPTARPYPICVGQFGAALFGYRDDDPATRMFGTVDVWDVIWEVRTLLERWRSAAPVPEQVERLRFAGAATLAKLMP